MKTITLQLVYSCIAGYARFSAFSSKHDGPERGDFSLDPSYKLTETQTIDLFEKWLQVNFFSKLISSQVITNALSNTSTLMVLRTINKPQVVS